MKIILDFIKVKIIEKKGGEIKEAGIISNTNFTGL